MVSDDELRELRQQLAEREREIRELRARIGGESEADELAAPITEYEEILSRLVQRIAMILQVERCVFVLNDRRRGDLYAVRPAFGLSDESLLRLRFRCGHGVIGAAFQSEEPQIFDAPQEPLLAEMGIKNGLCVPLVIEKRDEEHRLIERNPIGVVCGFNKRYGGQFGREDIQLLERMSRNAAAVIASAELFREVVEEKKELAATIESLFAGLVMVTKSGQIMQINRSARRIFGIGEQTPSTSLSFDEIVQDQRLRTLIERTLREHEEGDDEITLRHPGDEEGAEHIYQVQSALVRDEGGNPIGAVAIFNDITEIRAIDQMKSAFVATVSHELRTPLTSIKGFITTLLADPSGFDVDTQIEFYTIIDQECDRLTRLISDMLNLARIDSNQPLQPSFSPVDLKQLTEKVIAFQYRNKYYKGHRFVLDIPDDLSEIEADRDMLDQVMTNLVNNAIKYSPNGGDVTVRARPEEGGSVLVSVSDQGLGIPKEQQGKMFQRFHRVDNKDTRKIGGTGIGLYLVKHLVEVHGGEIWLESEFGKGTTFLFRLPFRQEDEDADE